MTFYSILGIPSDADETEIRRAYRLLARRYHPDRGKESSSERFRQIAEAYETLIEPQRRHIYDDSLQDLRTPSLAVPVEPMISGGGYRPFEEIRAIDSFYIFDRPSRRR